MLAANVALIADLEHDANVDGALGESQKAMTKMNDDNNFKLIIPDFSGLQSEEEPDEAINYLSDDHTLAEIDVKDEHSINCGWHQDWHNCTCGAFDKK